MHDKLLYVFVIETMLALLASYGNKQFSGKEHRGPDRYFDACPVCYLAKFFLYHVFSYFYRRTYTLTNMESDNGDSDK